MESFAPHQPHRIRSRAIRPRPPGQGFDVPFIQGAALALPVSLLLWLVLIWSAFRFI